MKAEDIQNASSGTIELSLKEIARDLHEIKGLLRDTHLNDLQDDIYTLAASDDQVIATLAQSVLSLGRYTVLRIVEKGALA